MSEPDFKISLDVEANLTKLDNSLSQAMGKVSAAGAKMQQVLFAQGVGGTGGSGFTGASGIASAAASGPGVMGTQVSFGGHANISAGNGNVSHQFGIGNAFGNINTNRGVTLGGGLNAMGQMAMLQQQGFGIGNAFGNINPNPNMTMGGNLNATTTGSLMHQAMVMNAVRGMPGAATGLQPGSLTRFGAALAASAYVGKSAVDASINMFDSIGSVRKAQQFQAWGHGGFAEQMSEAANAEAAARRVPFGIGYLYGAKLDFQRNSAYAVGDYANSASPAQKAEAAYKIRGLEYENQRGFMGGGYGGAMQGIQQDREQFERDVVSMQGRSTPNQMKRFVTEGISKLQRNLNETQYGQDQKLLDIKSYTQQSSLRAMGGGTIADLMEVQRSFRGPISLLEKQKDPRNRPELEALRAQQSAATMEAIVGSIRPAQEFTPGTMAAGNRVQGVFGQDQKTLQTLMHMDSNIGASLMQSLVGRN